MSSLYLRRSHDVEEVMGPLTTDQLFASGLSGDDCVSLRPDDPFVPMDQDLDRNARLRETILAAFPMDRAERYARFRLLLFVGLVPVLLLVMMDGGLWRGGHEGAAAAFVVNALSAIVVAVDLARPFPRYPLVTGAVFAATALRFSQLATTRWGESSAWLLTFATVAAFACGMIIFTSPSTRSMADHVRSALAMAPPTRLPPKTSPGFFRYIIYAIAAAALLPILLSVMRSSNTTLSVQLLVFLIFAWIVPYVGRVFVGREAPLHKEFLAGSLGIPLKHYRPNARLVGFAFLRSMTVALSTLVLSFALVRGAQSAIETVARTQQYLAQESAEPPALQRLLDAQRSEVGGTKRHDVPSWLLLTVLVVPIAEELVYRGLVQHALRRRLARRLAIGLAAVLFGLAHLVVFPTAVYQTILLGLSFGLAYERAGILASILAHMLWNLWLSL